MDAGNTWCATAAFTTMMNTRSSQMRFSCSPSSLPRSSRSPKATSATLVTSSNFRLGKHYFTRRSLVMHYGVNLPTIVNAQTLVLLAAEAEAAGWDGVFVWDTLYGNPEHEPEKQEIYDPWITLAAIAMS